MATAYDRFEVCSREDIFNDRWPQHLHLKRCDFSYSFEHECALVLVKLLVHGVSRRSVSGQFSCTNAVGVSERRWIL